MNIKDYIESPKDSTIKLIPTVSAKAIWTKEEEEIFANAEVLNVKKYRPIKTIRGTIGYFLKELDSTPEMVINYLENATGIASYAGIKNKLLIFWNRLDDWSRLRPDVLDHICREADISRFAFIKAITDSIQNYQKYLNKSFIAVMETDVLIATKKAAQNPANFKDRELAFNVAGALNKKPETVINVNQNQNTLNVNSPIPSFVKTIREVDESVKRPLELEEGKIDYIEAEILEEEKIKVENRI